MGLIRLIYRSRPFGFDQNMLNGILIGARACNLRDNVTGALICRHDLYLQWLEGPEAVVQATYDRIAQDDRHVEVTLLSAQPITQRLFASWSMRDDPARSWLWSAAEVDAGALERASPGELAHVFERVLAEAA